MAFVLMGAGLGLLILGGELLVRGASRLAAAIGLSPLVIGLTVVAYGTSAPELAVGLQASQRGEAALAVGNVVGSNIFNILFLLGLCALLRPLFIAQQLVRQDVPILIGASVLVLLFALDGRVYRHEGALLVAGMVAYTLFVVRQSRRESAAIQAEYALEYGPEKLRPRTGRQFAVQVAMLGVGVGLMALGARWLVSGAVTLAAATGLDERIIGLTIVAAGTGLPEVATSLVATLRGEREIAVGNVIGSNLSNIGAILGLTSLATPGGLPVGSSLLSLDIPVMIAAALACLPIFARGHTILRWEGAILLVGYVAYISYLLGVT
jgi:cation:H+ antiporter